jgi:phospholipid/cholesterol/gamma-HCH transport system permease protein
MLATLGRKVLSSISFVGRLSWFTAETIYASFSRPFFIKEIATQMFKIAFLSLPIVALTALFTGMVLALQTYTGFNRFSASGALATVVVLSITRELGPVLTGLMIAGRIGASMAAELGTMNVSDQLDAMKTLHVDSRHYLIAPRFIACIVGVPILVLIADVIGVWGGYFVSTVYLDFNASHYLDQTYQYLQINDVLFGLIKAFFFGAAISLIGCYCGYNASRGAEGVGLATTQSVVASSISIFVLNYILTAILF